MEAQTKTLVINTSFPGLVLLTITFVVLKALGYLDWSWLWVFSPLWIPWAIILALFVLAGLLGLLADYLDHRELKKRLARLDAARQSRLDNNRKL